MGIIRKALIISTGGLAGLVLPEEATRSSGASRPAAKAKAKAASATARPARQSMPPSAKQATKKSAPRRKPQAKPSRTMAETAQREGTAYELERIANLRREGALSEMEFAAAKAKILGMEMKAPEESDAPMFPAVEATITAARGLADMAGDGGMSSMPRDRGI